MEANNNHKLPSKKLQTWPVTKDFAKRIYEVTEQFPSTEQYELTAQIERASVSVMSNIAEGSARTSKRDQAHFSQLAPGSLMEAACQLQFAQKMGFISVEDYKGLKEYITKLSKKLTTVEFHYCKNRKHRAVCT